PRPKSRDQKPRFAFFSACGGRSTPGDGGGSAPGVSVPGGGGAGGNGPRAPMLPEVDAAGRASSVPSASAMAMARVGCRSQKSVGSVPAAKYSVYTIDRRT